MSDQPAKQKLDAAGMRDLFAARKGDTEAQRRMKARGWTAADMIVWQMERRMPEVRE
jgi:hypothetical protein